MGMPIGQEFVSAVQFALELIVSDPFVVALPIFSEPEREIPKTAFKRWSRANRDFHSQIFGAHLNEEKPFLRRS